jgi:hypothetical protein
LGVDYPKFYHASLPIFPISTVQLEIILNLDTSILGMYSPTRLMTEASPGEVEPEPAKHPLHAR